MDDTRVEKRRTGESRADNNGGREGRETATAARQMDA
jgi:hypothetical protein